MVYVGRITLLYGASYLERYRTFGVDCHPHYDRLFTLPTAASQTTTSNARLQHFAHIAQTEYLRAIQLDQFKVGPCADPRAGSQRSG